MSVVAPLDEQDAALIVADDGRNAREIKERRKTVPLPPELVVILKIPCERLVTAIMRRGAAAPR